MMADGTESIPAAARAYRVGEMFRVLSAFLMSSAPQFPKGAEPRADRQAHPQFLEGECLVGRHLQQGCRAELGARIRVCVELAVERKAQFRIIDADLRRQGGQEIMHRYLFAAAIAYLVVASEPAVAVFDHAEQQRRQRAGLFKLFLLELAGRGGCQQRFLLSVPGRLAARRCVGMDQYLLDIAMLLQGFERGGGIGVGPDFHLHAVEVRPVGEELGVVAEITNQIADRFIIRSELAIFQLKAAGNGDGPRCLGRFAGCRRCGSRC
ncbi:hypothetical protein ACFSUI_21365 [Ralstonia solanacearum]